MTPFSVLLAATGVGADVTQVFVFLLAFIVSAAAGYYVGSLLGQTESSNLQTILAVTRQKVDADAQRLRRLSNQFVGLDKSGNYAGDTLVIASKLTSISNELARLERHADDANERGGEA